MALYHYDYFSLIYILSVIRPDGENYNPPVGTNPHVLEEWPTCVSVTDDRIAFNAAAVV